MDPTVFKAEIKNVLQTYETTSITNVLELNKQMQEKLQAVREQLELSLRQVQRRYQSNHVKLTRLLTRGHLERGHGKRGAYLRGSTFYFKGNMFFKDTNYRNCPNNSDYEHRKNVENEMFPMDLELCGRHIWSMVDKLGIVQGVKAQILDYLHDKQQRKTNQTKLHKKVQLHKGKLVSLLHKVENTSFTIDWHEISAHHVRYRHTSTSCEAMWQMYLHPKFKKDGWSEIENQSLVEIAQKHDMKNWTVIAEEMGDRSEYQCLVQFYTRLYMYQPNRTIRWKKSDDDKLLECIKNHTLNGVINWNLVRSCFPHKSKAQIQGRYAYSLHPTISHEPFTDEEDVILLAAIKEYGTKFSRMPRTLFPNRSLVQLRSRYYNVLRTRSQHMPWTIQDDEKLLTFVAERGTSDWMSCSKMLDGRHSRTSCRTRFLTIKRYFDRNPSATLKQLPRLKAKRNLGGMNVNTENWEEKVVEMEMEAFIDDMKAAGETDLVKMQRNELQTGLNVEDETDEEFLIDVENDESIISHPSRKRKCECMQLKAIEVKKLKEDEFIDNVNKNKKLRKPTKKQIKVKKEANKVVVKLEEEVVIEDNEKPSNGTMQQNPLKTKRIPKAM